MGRVTPEALERDLEAVERTLGEAEERLLEIEGSPLVRGLRLPGRLMRDWRGRVGQLLLHSPLHPYYLKLVRPRAAADAYRLWVEREEAARAAPAREFGHGPVVSVLMPVRDPRREWLDEAVASVRRQTWPHWQLCVCDDASREPWVAQYFAALCAEEPRVRFTRAEKPLGIAGATNRAAGLAGGEYAGFLDQDDVLAPGALEAVAEAVEHAPCDLVYSDEDRLDAAGRRVEPIFKPAWSPELLLSCMYLGHFLVVRREALERAGGLRGAFDGSQDYDLALRVTEGGGAVRHIPRVLYHWRMHAGSTAARAGAKPYSHAAGFRALSEAVSRRSLAAVVEDGPSPNTYRVRRWPEGAPLASIVICSRDSRLLARCLRALETRTGYRNRQVVVVEHLAGAGAGFTRLAARHGFARVPYSGPFDFARMCNLGAREARGEILVFLNDDVAPLHAEWLTAMVAQAQRPDAGAVGARLLYPNGAIQHAGMAIGIMNGAGHPQRHTFGSGYWNWWPLARDISAVTGACLAVRRSVFEELGGFDPLFPVNYNDADLCLRARRAGYRVIYEPAAVLAHAECGTRRPGIRYAERNLWMARWDAWVERGDPFYNPNLSAASEDAALRPEPAPTRAR